MEETLINLLKRPICWLRVVEAICALICFWTIAAFKCCGDIKVKCIHNNTKGDVIQNRICIEFPFDLTSQSVYDCHYYDIISKSRPLSMSFEAQTLFFLWVGIISFCFSLITGAFYLRFWHKYHESTFLACPDLLATFSISAYWLAATFSFLSALISLQDYTSTKQMDQNLIGIGVCEPDIASCNVNFDDWTYYGGLNFVCVLAFVNIVLWAVSAFLIWRKIIEIKVSQNQHFNDAAYIEQPPVQGLRTRAQQHQPSAYNSIDQQRAIY